MAGDNVVAVQEALLPFSVSLFHPYLQVCFIRS